MTGASPLATGLAGAEAPEPHAGLGPTGGIPSAEFSAGPWGACKEGDCSCGQIWSIPWDCPVAKVESGEWGDEWPALRFIDAGGMSGTAVEAYMERSVYGELSKDAARANARLIAAAPTMFAALQATATFLGSVGGGKRKALRGQVAAALSLALVGDQERAAKRDAKYRDFVNRTADFASASAIEARRAETAQTGSVADESAVPKADAHPHPPQSGTAQ